MKFLIEFTQQNLAKFRSFIRLCNKTFSKSGIIMTISKDKKIRVAPDPFSISDKFQQDYFETKVIEIYKYFAFIDYPLIPPIPPLKNSTYHSLELKITEKYKNHNNNILIQLEDDYSNKFIIVTFRISREELNKLDDLLRTNFIYSEHLTIKATAKPDFMNIEESKNYGNAFLSIFDKPTNAIKSGILFKPLKVPYSIRDYEEECNNEERDEEKGSRDYNNLGGFLYGSRIKSKIFKKYCSMANKNVNKNLIIYNFRQRNLEEKTDKNNLIISYLNNSFYLGYYLNTNLTIEDINNEENFEKLKKIYKIIINGDILLKMLKNFKNDDNNPDYIGIWTKALIMKTDYFMNNNFDENENNNKNNNIFNNDEEESSYEKDQNSEDGEPNLSYMTLKTIFYYLQDVEKIEYEKDDENSLLKKQYVLDLIDNNIDDKHEELNKSLDFNYNEVKDNDFGRGDEGNLLFEEEEEEDNDIPNKEEDDDEEEKKIKKKKKINNKKKGKVKKKNKEEK